MYTIPFAADAPLTDAQFEGLCKSNPDVSYELTAKGELVVNPPTGGWGSIRESRLLMALTAWAQVDGRGYVTSSTGLYLLPNGAKRSPDAGWVLKSKFDALPDDVQDGFIPLVPDFVAELRSLSDPLKPLQVKMAEYMEVGVRLGWLIDPQNRSVTVYRQDGSTEQLTNPESVDGEGVLVGFKLAPTDIWD
ncbi:MAG: Uma2 family endonuclease [Cyanobacteria bacterium P01_G01_bin.4]